MFCFVIEVSLLPLWEKELEDEAYVLFFFACPKKNQKKTPTKDYIPFVGLFPDLAFVLL